MRTNVGLRAWLPWVTLALLGLASALAPVGAAEGQPAPNDPAVVDFTGNPGARTICVRADRPEFQGTACWNAFRLGRGEDPVKDYFVWGFQGSATARDGHRLQRLKLRMVGPGSENVRWQPGSYGEFEKTENIEVALGLPGQRQSTTFRVLPGHVRPYSGRRVYHVSWFEPSGRGVACCPEAQIGAITTWSTAEGTEVMPAELTMEVRYW